jgi:hypothetical protein
MQVNPKMHAACSTCISGIAMPLIEAARDDGVFE